MSAGVIDIGSSSIKLIIGEKEKDEIKILESLKNPIPLGVNTFLKGRISQDTINQTINFLERYKQVLQEYAVTETRVVATTAVREARNRDIFIETVRRKTGFNVEVFNIGDIVYYIDVFLSHKLKKTYPIHEKNLLIVELGAGSVDVSVMERGYTLMNVGISIGTLWLKQFMSQLGESLEETYVAVHEYIENEIMYLKKMIPRIRLDDIILIDENYSPYLQNILPSNKRESNFFQFRQKESEDFLANLANRNPEEIASAYKIPVEVANTIVGYAIIVNKLFKLTKNKYINILETSLPEAILANILFRFDLTKESNKTKQLVSVVQHLCREYKVDLNHVRHVAKLAETLFNEFKDALGLKEGEVLYLILAGYLHDIGMFLSNRSHHKHSEYIISSLSLFRLTEEEMKIIAAVARYHRRGDPSFAHLIYGSLAMDKQILVQKLSALLRIANALDRSHRQKVKKLEVKFNRKRDVSLIVYTEENFVLEKAFFLEKKGMFEEISGNSINLIVKSQNAATK